MRKRNFDGTYRDTGMGGKNSYSKLVRFPEPYGRWLADIDNPTEFIRQCVIEKFDTLMTAKLLMLNPDTIIDKTVKNSELTNQYISSNILNAIREAKLEGWHIVAVSNQEGIERGQKTLDVCKDEMQELNDAARTSNGQPLFDYIIFCSHCVKDGDTCWVLDCKQNVWIMKEGVGLVRKPNPGMLYLACYLVKSHPWRTLMIGNSIDRKAASLAGIDFQDFEEWLRS
ncbi:putative hydrolase, HAD-superfamily, subfamily IIIA (plasmid) [Calothrix sp. NIES-4071]|nr:putative hydrolase, HAD-superfamily, subfamily IIIA [Calothrix sp. NIES-4071]BAZ64573.1 putative hydrolase, HAD-superfamily, subfamily IIIA [Calothrix sp. NIES-4105]